MKHSFFALPPFVNLRANRGERKGEKDLHDPSLRNQLRRLLQHPPNRQLTQHPNLVLPILRQPLQSIHSPSGSVYSPRASFIIPSLLSSHLDDVRSIPLGSDAFVANVYTALKDTGYVQNGYERYVVLYVFGVCADAPVEVVTNAWVRCWR